MPYSQATPGLDAGPVAVDALKRGGEYLGCQIKGLLRVGAATTVVGEHGVDMTAIEVPERLWRAASRDEQLTIIWLAVVLGHYWLIAHPHGNVTVRRRREPMVLSAIVARKYHMPRL